MADTTTISGLPDASAPLHGAERLPLDDLVAGATRDASTLQIAQTLPDATTTSRGAMTAAQALKLAGIATGATVNATDAALRDRATHTGEQAITTITGLSNALASKVSSVGLDTPAGQGLSVSNSPVNSSGTLVISVASGYQIPTAAQLASFLTSATAVTTYQPLDSDLTAIAALSTTSFGRGLLALADAAAGRTTLGLGTSSTPQFAGLGLTGGNLTARQSATQDAIIVSGRSGGNGSFSVTFTPATLTASQTLTAPNVSGTIVTTGDTGTVTSAMIANGTIVNDDISASAAIADGKLGTISTAGKVSNSATTATSANTPSAIVARDGSGNFTANVITASLTGNVTGNVTGNLTGTASAIADGTVTSDKIVNGTIVDADISNSAEIAVSKLADGSARQLLQTDAAGTGVEWTSNVDIPGTLDVTGTATFDGIAIHPRGALGTPSITFTDDLNTGIWSPGAAQVAISTAGNERARIDSAGGFQFKGAGTAGVTQAVSFNGSAPVNSLVIDSTGKVGLGTGSPSQMFEVSGGNIKLAGSTSQPFTNFWGNGDNSAFFLPYGFLGSSGAFAVSLYSNGYRNTSPGFTYMGINGNTSTACGIDLEPNGNIFIRSGTALGTSLPARMFINSSGNVGIGTTSPGSLLECANTGAASANTRQVTFANGIGSTEFKLAAWTGVSTNSSGDILGSLGLSFTTTRNSFINFHRGGGTTGGFMSFTVNNDNEAARIDSSGRLLIGTSSAQSSSSTGLIPWLQLNSANSSISSSTFGVFANSASNSASVRLFRNRATTAGGFDYTGGTVQANDVLGSIEFWGVDGGATPIMRGGASIQAICASTPTTAEMPTDLVFLTTADGATGPAERARIDSSGRFGLGTSGGSPEALLHIAPGNTSATSIGGRSISYGANLVSSSGRSGYLVRVANNFTDDNDNAGFMWLYPFDTGGNAGHKVFRSATGSTLVDRFWVNQGGGGYFAGRLLIGASTNYLIGDSSGWTLQASNSAGISNLRTGDDSSPSYLVLAKTRATSAGSFARLENNDIIGDISFVADDGTDYATNAAKIRCHVDGTPGADDMPGRLVFLTTVDGASGPAERMRITNDGVIAYNQAAPVSKSTAATLTIAELKGGIIQYTGNAQTLTLPTGTLSEGGFSGLYSNMTFEWSVINTGSGTCTVAGDTGHTVVGAGAVAAGSSGRFASRRTGANTFVTYRLS